MDFNNRMKPEKCAPDYIYSKNLTKTLNAVVPKQYDQKDKNPSEILISIQQKFFDVDENLQNTKINEQKQKFLLNQRWENLKVKEKILRREFQNFEKFVNENIIKMNRGKERIKEFKSKQQSKGKELQKLKTKYQQLLTVKENLTKKLADYQQYQDFLLKYLETYPTLFTSTQEILNKYSSLTQIKKYLANFLEYQYSTIQEAKDNLKKIIEDKSLQIMGLKIYIVNLQERYKSAKSKSSECDQILLKIKNVTIEKIKEYDMVKKVIYDIYRYMVQSKKDPVLYQENDVENQLLYIKRMLYELHKINKLITQKKKPKMKKTS